MAIMIPSVISPEVKSTAEKRIFKWFENAPGTDKWIVLHSLGIANHNKVIYGETDFLVLAPHLGLFALEIKGGRVRRENGIWYFTNKYDQTNQKERGPFEQAREGIFSIVEEIKKRTDLEHRHIDSLLFGYGVMFPDIEFNSSGIEEEQWQVFDSRDGMDVKRYIKRLSEGIKTKWESVYGPASKSKFPDSADVRYIANLLRGDFDFAVSISSQLINASEAQIVLTNEQYRCLDQLDDNPRCLIQGPAGTGKTLLALEEVKKSVARGEKVALFCFNVNLADWLSNYFLNQEKALSPCYVGTLHKYMAQVAKECDILPEYPQDAEMQQQFFQNDLPEAAALALMESGAQFDTIVLDEAQDLIRDSYLEVFNASLKKGLTRGKWTMFGDFSMQAIYTDGISGSDLIDKLEDYTSFIRFRLTVNCRNTKRICQEIETVTGFKELGSLLMNVDGPPVQHITWSTMETQRRKLQSLLKQLEESHIAPEQITILSPRKREDSVVSLLEGYMIKDYKIPPGPYTSFCTIQAYKGLENKVVIITDIEDFSSEKLMYVGLSRACFGLYVLESDVARKEYDHLLMSRLM